MNQLGAFINQVTSLVEEGQLAPEQGQPLIDATSGIIEELSEGVAKPVSHGASGSTWGRIKASAR